MKPGTKLKSQVRDTEGKVLRFGDGNIECGGTAIYIDKPETPGTIDQSNANETVMGKRYVDGAGTFQLLCIKPKMESLSFNGTALAIKDAKPLSASD